MTKNAKAVYAAPTTDVVCQVLSGKLMFYSGNNFGGIVEDSELEEG